MTVPGRHDIGRPSSTALGNAFMRAFHSAHEPKPVHTDLVARQLLSEQEWTSFRTSVLASSAVRGPQAEQDPEGAIRRYLRAGSVAAPHVLLRGRHTEDALRRTCERGASQYVLLGAGFDSFALRRPEWAERLTVYEVDRSATQELKRARVARLRPDGVPGLRMVPADLAKQRLDAVLRRIPGLDGTRHTFVAWSGVTYYLDEKAISATLEALGDFFTGGLTIVLDYWEAAQLAEPQDPLVASMAASVRRNGEPFVWGASPGEMAALAGSTGYRVTADVSAVEVAETCRAQGSVTLAPHPIGRFAELER
ncbi:class I SAM-dependent methyltransferase [Streptomyces sp. NBC_00464]|uniref:class I SAM-dependent methyltransferase n=1 Tax=Streptomyces sp. NBC_00464 TaxID=2975751 RepID=UPI002E180174